MYVCVYVVSAGRELPNSSVMVRQLYDWATAK